MFHVKHLDKRFEFNEEKQRVQIRLSHRFATQAFNSLWNNKLTAKGLTKCTGA